MTPFFMYNVSDQTQQNTKGKSLLMDNIILYLLTIIQEQHQQICWLILFICRYIPLKQWLMTKLHSPQNIRKFLTDKLPHHQNPSSKQDWAALERVLPPTLWQKPSKPVKNPKKGKNTHRS